MLFCSVTEGGIIELHFTMWGVLSVKSRKQITVCGYAVINTPAPMKALDKSFLLQISAKTKAVLSLSNWGKASCLHQNLHLFLFPWLPVHPFWQLSFPSYNGPGLLRRDWLPLPCTRWWRQDRGVWVWGKTDTWYRWQLEWSILAIRDYYQKCMHGSRIPAQVWSVHLHSCKHISPVLIY